MNCCLALVIAALWITSGNFVSCRFLKEPGEKGKDNTEIEKLQNSSTCAEKCLCSDNVAICKGIDLEENFTGLNISILSVSDSYFPRVTNNTFSNIKALKELRLTRSKVRFVSQSALLRLPLLEKVSLSQNDIEAIGETSSRKYLFFDKNTAHLPDYNRAANLREVDLSVNSIGEISAESLYGMKYVQYLNLSRNNLQKITRGFRDLMGLKVLDLRYNRIREIDESFGGYQLVMKELYMSHNHISAVPVFEDYCCWHLCKIDLSFNNLQKVSSSGVGDCKNLTFINLSNNKISEIYPTDFSGNIELRNLLLDDNIISVWSNETFRRNKNLEELHMNDNLVRRITARGLAGLTKMKIFEIANNQVREIEPTAFDKCVWLNYINLSGNKIGYIAPNTFKKLSLLRVVNLTSNKLTLVHAEWFLTFNGKYYLDSESNTVKEEIVGSLATFKMEENPWSCDCQSRELLHWASTQILLDTRLLPNINCVYPHSLSGTNLFALRQEHLSCGENLFSVFYLFAFHFPSILFLIIFFSVLIWKRSKTRKLQRE